MEADDFDRDALKALGIDPAILPRVVRKAFVGKTAAGIPVATSFDPSLYDGVDLVIYTGAIHDDDPVLKTPREKGIPTMTRAAAFGEMMRHFDNPIGVAGTHGKSTTTAMLGQILEKAQKSPTVVCGAQMRHAQGRY